MTASSTTSGLDAAARHARIAPTTPSATKTAPSVSADGLVTAPELPMIDAPAAWVDACKSATSVTGPTTTAASDIRDRTDDVPATIAANTAAPAGAIQTGHDRNTPTPHAAASQR